MIKLTIWGYEVRVSCAKKKPAWAEPYSGASFDRKGDGYRVWVRGTLPRGERKTAFWHEIGHLLGRQIASGNIDPADAEGDDFANLFVSLMSEVERAQREVVGE